MIGILYATVQAEMKRLLAHSTIENMGIVAAGIGAAMTFLATGHPVVARYRTHRGALSPRQSLGVQGASFRRDRRR